ncbi:PREDICTED: uncharacterized protein LOC105449216 [Wasmannia auropunctata]|uniref:uncharacterized protein LOC105449216 n=1 Tax=Wasmannia auropunctata TaxID=64793 RepID=UPI0005EEC04E|nr:PREDICTED: uncharacterized protein LOC105449216 [Wasmannia auropunctata]
MDAVLTSPVTVKNCMGWTFSPSPQVGSPVGNLETTQTSLDSAARVGCKSQSYTSWDCVSRLYVGGVYIVETADEHGQWVEGAEYVPKGDTPTPEEWKALSCVNQQYLDGGVKIYIRGKGVMTRQQAKRLTETTPASRVVASGSKGPTTRKGATARTEEEVDDPTPDQNTGFYYSDIIPVRCVAVSTMICGRETDPVPYSPQYQILADRLNDPAQTGVLSAVVRGPNVRDATAMSLLVKAMLLRPSTRYEIAAVLRCGAMGLSVGQESYACDPIPYRFVRKPKTVSGTGMDIMQKPGVTPNAWKAIAMPLDTFVALENNSYYSTTPDGFTYGELDVNWTAVPVPSRLLRQSHLLAYLFSFLSSDAWSGTVTYGSVTTRDGPNGKVYKMVETYVPVVNSINVPGVRNVCLVLIDETSPNCSANVKLSLRDVAVDVPVWKGPQNEVPVSIWALWDKFWNTENIPGIRRDTTFALSEICTRLAVSDTCGTALSLLAELYGQWYYGIAPALKHDEPTPDYTAEPYGSWTYDGSYLDKTKAMKSHLFNLDQKDKLDARRRSIAYNFSGISPQHEFPTGVVRVRYVGQGERLRITWSTQQPEVAVPAYNIQTMTSVSRVATAMGLILTHTESYRFASPTGFVHWVHMLSCAISFSTSAFLALNDISPRDWAGVDNRYDVAHRDSVLNAIKSAMYGGITVHLDIENIMSNIQEWDLDIMAEYFMLSPYNNVDWMTFSPVPAHCTQQWVDKMGLTGGTIPKEITMFYYKSRPYMAMKVKREYGEHKFNMVTTIDMYRRFPQAIVREPGEGYVCLLHWVDNVAGYSNAACNNNRVLVPTDMYESLTYCAPVMNIGIPYSDTTNWYIIGSNYEYGDPALSGLKVTPIQWPGPPLLETLWQGAKNYILKPAASALAGFLTGGPAGAAVAGATHIAQ